jgi:hypothetical protein
VSAPAYDRGEGEKIRTSLWVICIINSIADRSGGNG